MDVFIFFWGEINILFVVVIVFIFFVSYFQYFFIGNDIFKVVVEEKVVYFLVILEFESMVVNNLSV